jgi:hypothetical protein
MWRGAAVCWTLLKIGEHAGRDRLGRGWSADRLRGRAHPFGCPHERCLPFGMAIVELWQLSRQVADVLKHRPSLQNIAAHPVRKLDRQAERCATARADRLVPIPNLR